MRDAPRPVQVCGLKSIGVLETGLHTTARGLGWVSGGGIHDSRDVGATYRYPDTPLH